MTATKTEARPSCPDCKGTGTRELACATCCGFGVRRPGSIHERSCMACRGSGKEFLPCARCSGTGKID